MGSGANCFGGLFVSGCILFQRSLVQGSFLTGCLLPCGFAYGLFAGAFDRIPLLNLLLVAAIQRYNGGFS